MDADRLITSEPTMDQGSVLVVGKVRSKITSQPEVVPFDYSFIAI